MKTAHKINKEGQKKKDQLKSTHTHTHTHTHTQTNTSIKNKNKINSHKGEKVKSK